MSQAAYDTNADLFLSSPHQIAMLVGTAILPSFVYGINSTLVFMTLRLPWKGRTADTRKLTLLMTTYVALLCALCTAHLVLSCALEAHSLVEVIRLLEEFAATHAGSYVLIKSGLSMAVDFIYLFLTCLTDGLLVRVDD